MALKTSFKLAVLAVWGILYVQTAFISSEKYYSWGRQKDNGLYPASNFKLVLPPKVSNYTPLSSEFNFVWIPLDNLVLFLALVTKTPNKNNDYLRKSKWKVAVNILRLDGCHLLERYELLNFNIQPGFRSIFKLFFHSESLPGIVVAPNFCLVLKFNSTASYFKVTWKLT